MALASGMNDPDLMRQIMAIRQNPLATRGQVEDVVGAHQTAHMRTMLGQRAIAESGRQFNKNLKHRKNVFKHTMNLEDKRLDQQRRGMWMTLGGGLVNTVYNMYKGNQQDKKLAAAAQEQKEWRERVARRFGI